MKHVTFCKIFFSIVLFSLFFSCNDYETGGLPVNWVFEATYCSTSDTEYVAPGEGQTGSYAFDKYVNENYPVQFEWRRNAANDGLCNLDPNWGFEATYCSMSETGYVEPTAGQTGYYAFDKYVNQNNAAEIKWERNAANDGQCGSPGDYTPVFLPTTITSGNYVSFTAYGQRIFAAEQDRGILEFRNGEWLSPEGMSSDMLQNIYYPKFKTGANGKLFVSTSKGVYFQTGNNIYNKGYWTETLDMSGGLGGSNTNFFVSAGGGYQGVFKWDEYAQQFVATNLTVGTFYSIEALDETQVFFGSYNKSNGTSGVTHGVMRYDGSSIVPTNIVEGSYSLAVFDGRMYAANATGVLVWDGSNFVPVFTGSGGTLKNENGNLYLIASTGVYKCSGGSFSLLKDGLYIKDVVEYDDILYLIGSEGIQYLKNGNWYNIATGATVGIASSSGLYVAQPGSGILKMVKN